MYDDEPNEAGRLLDYVAEKRPDATFIHFEGVDYSYREVKRQADAYAKALLAVGARRGDRAALWMGNSEQWPIIQLACASIGVVLVGLNTRFHTEEIHYVLAQSQTSVLLFTHSFLKEVFSERICAIVPALRKPGDGTAGCPELPFLRLCVDLDEEPLPGALPVQEFLQAAAAVGDEELAQAKAAVCGNDASLIVYTSGTTGSPKGAMLGQEAVCMRMRIFSEWLGMVPEDRTFFAMPYYHTFGCVYATYSTLASQSTLCLMRKFEPHAALELIASQRCTVIDGVPTAFQMMLSEPDFGSYDLSCGRTGVIGGSPASPTLLRQVRDTMAPLLVSGLGQTESTAGFTSSRPDDPDWCLLQTQGVVLPGNEVAIKDPDTGAELACDEVGEICVRSPYNMLGYYNMPQKTAQAIDADGFLHTGDMGKMGADGYLRLTGRLKDMIIVGGVNAYPNEIEHFLCSLEGVADAQVVGKRDERLGEVPVAFVRLEEGCVPDAASLIEQCLQGMANYKVPREILFVDSFPMSGTGKVQKYKLRELVNGSANWLFEDAASGGAAAGQAATER